MCRSCGLWVPIFLGPCGWIENVEAAAEVRRLIDGALAPSEGKKKEKALKKKQDAVQRLLRSAFPPRPHLVIRKIKDF